VGFSERLCDGRKLRGGRLLVDYAHRDRISALMLLRVGCWRQGISLPRMLLDISEQDGIGEKRRADPIRYRGVADEAVDRSGDR
jgi:hypothetical protein